MHAKDRCPSCHQPVSPGDFLCANCELILDPALAPAKASTEVSVVRRMLEMSQPGLPAARPSSPERPGAKRNTSTGAEGPTRVASLPPERPGVPLVVASLDRVTRELTEFDAWVVSLIDGASDTPTLAKKAGLRELELRVVLETLHDRMVIDFADEPLPDEPLFAAPADEEGVDGDEPLEQDDELPPGSVILGTPTLEVPGGSQALTTAVTQEVPKPAARAPEPSAFGAALAAVTGVEAAFVPGAAVAPPPPPPPTPPPAPHVPPPVRVVRPAPEAAPRYPGRGLPPSFAPTPASGSSATARPPERTDPRIAYTGQANRKVLDALKKVKRRGEGAPASQPPQSPQPAEAPPQKVTSEEADRRAASALQIALRMEQGGRLEEAVRYLEKSISQSPDAPSLYNRLAIIVMRERADLRRAESLLQKAVDLAPDNEVYAKNLKQVVQQRALRSKR